MTPCSDFWDISRSDPTYIFKAIWVDYLGDFLIAMGSLVLWVLISVYIFNIYICFCLFNFIFNPWKRNFECTPVITLQFKGITVKNYMKICLHVLEKKSKSKHIHFWFLLNISFEVFWGLSVTGCHKWKK